MHLDIRLPLLSELEQHQRAFWDQHTPPQRSPDHPPTPDPQGSGKVPDPLPPGPPDPQGSAGACVCLRNPVRRGSPDPDSTDPSPPSQTPGQGAVSQGEASADHGDSDGVMGDRAVDALGSPSPQHKSPEGDSNLDAWSTYERNPHSEGPEAGAPSQSPPSAPSPAGGPNRRNRRKCRVLWDRTTENGSFL